MSDVDIAIVGGGISGLYTAWRLSTLPNPPKVAVFESSAKLGGRIDTNSLPVPAPGASADFGAMRFVPSMKLVSTLLEKLSIQTELFPGIEVQETFLRGVTVDATSSNLPYKLGPGESNNLGVLFANIINGAVPNAFTLTQQQWRTVTETGKFKGSELWNWGMQNVAEEFVSNEAFEYLFDAAGLDSGLLSTNAAVGLRCLTALLPDFANKQVFRPVDGFSSLITALSDKLAACPTCTVNLDSRLLRAGRSGTSVTLEFAPSQPGTVNQVTADKVIFAMPRRALELIDMSGLFANQAWGRLGLMDKLAQVEGIPAFKLCMVYDQPWWQTVVNGTTLRKDGYAVTDLPLRQVFFGLGVGSTPESNERVLLASYADTRSARYWSGQANVSANMPLRGAQGPIKIAGPGNLTAAIQNQLFQLLHFEGPLPQPLSVGYMDWSADPFGGGWHEWNPGVNVAAAIPDMRQPIPNTPVYVCGEAYSWFQSWIEGALMSAERLLQDQLQIPAADWLPQDYDLGP